MKTIILASVLALSSLTLACGSSSGSPSGQGQAAATDAGDGGGPLCCIFTDGTQTSMPYPESQCNPTDDGTGLPPDGAWACVENAGAGAVYTCKCILNQQCLASAGGDAGAIVMGQVKPCQ